MRAGTDVAVEPRDTLVVVGGRPLDRVDVDGIARAAERLGRAGEALRSAAAGCWAAATDLERSLWTPEPFGTRGPDRLAAQRRAATLAADVARRLHERASVCDGTRERLLRAAGIYVRAESVAERALGGAVAVSSGLLALGVTHAVRVPPVRPWAAFAGRIGVLLAVGADAAGPAGRPRPAAPGAPGPSRVPAAPAPSCTPAPGGLAAGVTRAIAPFADEAVSGMALGVSAAAPLRSRALLGVPGAARVLGSLAHELLPRTRVRVVEVPAGDVPGGRPARDRAPSGTVDEALARTADLYPWGSGIPGRRAAGAPVGTLAVERVEHPDGSVSWTVLVPGTQGIVSARHPFDGLTDLDLVARRSADVTVAMTEALELAGAAPQEQVVLVGHSLGGIAAMALASSPAFLQRYRLGGVVTAGSPTATFPAPPGVPVLHLENDEELVSQLDGRPTDANPATADRVTVGRALRRSSHPADVASAGVAAAHGTATHLRTLDLARRSGNAQVGDVVGRLEQLLSGDRSTTRFYTARRTAPEPAGPVVMAPGAGPVSPSSGPALR